MADVTVCDCCGQRLDGASLEARESHIRATLRLEQMGRPDELVERDFCEYCAEGRRDDFAAAPFTDSLSRGPKKREPDAQGHD